MTPMLAPRHAAPVITNVGRVLSALGLVTAFGHVSARSTEHTYTITRPGDLGYLAPADTVEVRIADDVLPREAPPEAMLHSAIYRVRPEVGAIVRAQPPSAFAFASVCEELTPLHGQGAWLGATVPVFPVPRLCRDVDTASAAAHALGGGSCLLLRANGSVSVAADPSSAATLTWLLSMSCDLWLRASSAGRPMSLDQADIEAWQAAGVELLPRLWRHLERSAKIPPADDGGHPVPAVSKMRVSK